MTVNTYQAGTVTVTNGSQTVTLADGSFTGNVNVGAVFVTEDNVAYSVASIDSATQLTLASTFGGDSASGLGYQITNDFTTEGFPLLREGDIRPWGIQAEAVRRISNYLSATQASNANLTALSDLTGAADKLSYFTGVGAMDLADLSAFVRGLLGSASAPALQVAMGVRELLTASRTYYVSTTGSDSNDGLAIGTPFATIAKALTVISATIDTAGFAVTIQLADGTYTNSVGVIPSWVGGGQVIINGNVSTPSNVILTSSISTGVVNVTNPGHVKVQNLKLQSTVGNCLSVTGGGSKSTVGVGVVFGTCAGVHIQANAQSLITVGSGYTINGNAQMHVAASGGIINFSSGITITLTGTPAFSVRYCQAVLLGYLNASGLTFSGSATGARYFSGTNSIIFTNGGGASYFPGDSAGAASSGGLYI